MAQLKRYKETPNTLRQSPNADLSGTKSSIDMFNNIAREASALSNQFFQDAATKARRDGTTGGKNAMSMNPDGTITAHSVPDAGEIFTQSFQDAQNHAVKSATINSMNEKLMDLSAKLQNDKNRTSVFDIESKAIVEKFINTTDPSLQKEIALEATLTQSKLARQLTNIDLQEAKAQNRADVLQRISRQKLELYGSAKTGAGFNNITSDELNEGDYNPGTNKNIKQELISAELAAQYKLTVDDITRAQKNNLITADEGVRFLKDVQRTFITGLGIRHFENEDSFSKEVLDALEEIETKPDNIRGVGFIKIPENLTIGLGLEDRKLISKDIENSIKERIDLKKQEASALKLKNTDIERAITSAVKLNQNLNKPTSMEMVVNKIETLGGDPKDFISKINDWLGISVKVSKSNAKKEHNLNLGIADSNDKNNKGEVISIKNSLSHLLSINSKEFPGEFSKALAQYNKNLNALTKRIDSSKTQSVANNIEKLIRNGDLNTTTFESMYLEATNKELSQRNLTDKEIIKNYTKYQNLFSKVQGQINRSRGFSPEDETEIVNILKDPNLTLTKKLFHKKIKMDEFYKKVDTSLNTEQGILYNMTMMIEFGHATQAFEDLVEAGKNGNLDSLQRASEIFKTVFENKRSQTFELSDEDVQLLDDVGRVLNLKPEDSQEFEKGVYRTPDPENARSNLDKFWNEINNPQNQEINENIRKNQFLMFPKTMLNYFEKSKYKSGGIQSIINKKNPVVQNIGTTDFGEESNDGFFNVLPFFTDYIPWQQREVIMPDTTIKQLASGILKRVQSLTPNLTGDSLANGVYSQAVKENNLGVSPYGPFNSTSENGKTKAVRTGNSVTLYAPEKHLNNFIARNYKPIIQNELQKLINIQIEFLNKVNEINIFDDFGTATEIENGENGNSRLELIADPNSTKDNHTYSVIIHPKENSNAEPIKLTGVLELNELSAQSYRDSVNVKTKDIKTTLDESIILKPFPAIKNMIEKSRFPNVIAEKLAKIEDASKKDKARKNIESKTGIISSRVRSLFGASNDISLDKATLEGNPNQSAIDLLKKHEGFVGDTGDPKTTLIKKNDTKGSVVGHGMNLKFMEKNERQFYNDKTKKGERPLNKEDAETLTRMRVSSIVNKFKKQKSFKWENISRNRRDALINVVYQNGWNGFTKGFKETVKLIKAGEWTKASEEIVKSSWGRTYKTRAREIQKLLKDG